MQLFVWLMLQKAPDNVHEMVIFQFFVFFKGPIVDPPGQPPVSDPRRPQPPPPIPGKVKTPVMYCVPSYYII